MPVHTLPGDISYEPFSGSQIIAAPAQSRRRRAVQIEPVLVDVAIQRWQEFTGRKAERLSREKGVRSA